MSTTYFKRFRMEIDLGIKKGISPICARHPSSRPGKLDLSPFSIPAPEGYFLLPWDVSLLDVHAKTKYLSFCEEIDAHVFPCFRDLAGCLRLMHDITGKTSFMPEATWLAGYRNGGDSDDEYCGTIQGIRQAGGIGSVQNLGIVAGHRDRGLGTCLLFKALDGFRRVGLRRASLEVTAENDDAVRLYRRHGFEIVKTVYKAVEMACC